MCARQRIQPAADTAAESACGKLETRLDGVVGLAIGQIGKIVTLEGIGPAF